MDRRAGLKSLAGVGQAGRNTQICGAHCCRNDGPDGSPRLDMSDLRDAARAISNVRAGHGQGEGLLIRRYPVNSRMTLLTLYPFGNW